MPRATARRRASRPTPDVALPSDVVIAPPSRSLVPAHRVRQAALALALALILLGGWFRMNGRNWDDGHMLHPDERFLFMVTGAIATPPSFGDFLDTANSSMNPHNRNFSFYVYGTFPIFLTRLLHERLPTSWGSDIMLLGRAVCMVFDFLTILVTFFLGRLLWGATAGWLGAALYALAVLPIQLSHFYTVDPPATFFGMTALYFAVLATRRERRWLPYAFGIAAALATASKISLVLITPIYALALFVFHRREGRSPKEALRLGWKPLLTAAIVFLVLFRFCQPYAFTGPGILSLRLNPKWLANIEELSRLAQPSLGFPPAVQWIGRPVWFALRNLVLWGLGTPLGLLSWAGIGLLAWRLRRRYAAPELPLVAWCLGYFFVFGVLGSVKTMRYQLPIYPVLCLAAAAFVLKFRLQTKRPRLVALTVGGIVFSGTLVWATAFAGIYSRPVTRVDASRWILDNLPAPMTVVVREEGVARKQLVPLPTRTGVSTDLEVYSRFEGEVMELSLFRLRRESGAPTSLTVEITSGEKAAVFSKTTVPLAWPASGVLDNVRIVPPAGTVFHLGARYLIRVAAQGGAVRITRPLIAHETAWDDGLPIRLDSYDPFGGIYDGDNSLDMYWSDNEEKRGRFKAVLEKADMISISSNRQYATITRLPEHFPTSIAFYRALMGCDEAETIANCYYDAVAGRRPGSLGFEIAATFESAPVLGPWRRSDQRAEEAFTVYDHPKVLLFRKRADFDAAEMRRVIDTFPLPRK